MAKRLQREIEGASFFGETSFLKVKADSLNIERVKISVVKTKDNQSVQNGDYYMHIPDMLALCADIKLHFIQKEAKAIRDKNPGAKFLPEIRSYQGGKSEAEAHRSDGKAISRMLKLYPGTSQPYAWCYLEGPGHTNEKGLIIPDYGTKPEIRIFVGCTDDALLKFACCVEMEIMSFRTAQYVKGEFMVDTSDTSNNKPGARQQPVPQRTQQTTKPAPQQNQQTAKPTPQRTQQAARSAPQQTQQTTPKPVSPQAATKSKIKKMKCVFSSSFGKIAKPNGEYLIHADITAGGHSFKVYFKDEPKFQNRKKEFETAMENRDVVEICYEIQNFEGHDYIFFVQ